VVVVRSCRKVSRGRMLPGRETVLAGLKRHVSSGSAGSEPELGGDKGIIPPRGRPTFEPPMAESRWPGPRASPRALYAACCMLYVLVAPYSITATNVRQTEHPTWERESCRRSWHVERCLAPPSGHALTQPTRSSLALWPSGPPYWAWAAGSGVARPIRIQPTEGHPAHHREGRQKAWPWGLRRMARR
jgi:hypothetical protein